MRLLSSTEIAKCLHVNVTALNELVSCGKIPYKQIPFVNGETFRFVPDKIYQWAEEKPKFIMDNQKYVERFKKKLEERFPETIKELEEFSAKFSEPRQPKGYYLSKVKSKK